MTERGKSLVQPDFRDRSTVVSFLRSFMPFLWNNFIHDRITLSAGSLAFQTLLSIVPLLAVILSILKVFAVFVPLKRYIEDFLVQNFMPDAGVLLNRYLTDFIGKTATVPLLGGLFLFIIALFLISTIDHTLNEIWEVRAPRKTLQGFTLYWTVLTLGPVLIGSSLAASSYVWYTVFTEGPLLELKTRLLSYLPFLNSILAFFLLYMLVPNRRVRFLHAFSGALFAAMLFELSKKWFAFYIAHIATFEHIYGALSVIPMLFFWIYLGWLVVLIGAEFVFCLGAIKPQESVTATFNPLQRVGVILSVLAALRRSHESGQTMNMKRLLKSVHPIPHSLLQTIVDILLQHDLIHLSINGDFALGSALCKMTLFDLYTIIPQGFAADENGLMVSAGNSVHLETISRRVSECLKSSMECSLASLLDSE